jgi:LmbE family N-acetylglucosaminyl deacetylase
MKKKENILCFVAHGDDLEISMGGTAYKYSKEGKNIIEIIFSYGEFSHLKREVIIKTRIKESKEAAKFLGVKEVIFLGLPDARIKKAIKERDIKNKIKKIIKQYKPVKIFTHFEGDPHPDHRAVSKVVVDAVKELNGYDLYGFEIWNLADFRLAKYPLLYVDVSKFFKKKLEVLNLFKSQKGAILQLMPAIYTRAKIAGEKIKVKYAEKFYKLK